MARAAGALEGRRPADGAAGASLAFSRRAWLRLSIVWIAPYVCLAILRFGLGRADLGMPFAWIAGLLGLQLFATIGVVESATLARAALASAALFYGVYLCGIAPGFAAVDSVLPQLCIAGLMALSVWLPFASGQLSLAQAGFMAVGAYASAWLTVEQQWPFAMALGAGALVTAAIGLVVSYPALRLRGIYLAVATLGLGEVIRIFFLNFEPTGGAFGFTGIPKRTETWQLVLALAAASVVLVLMMRSRVGRAIAAVRQDPVAAAVAGIEITRVRVLTFTLGAFLAGLAGGFQAHYVRFVGPENYGLPALVEWLAMVMLGGFQTPIGPLAGVVVLGTFPELVRFLADWRLTAYGLLLAVLLIYRPDGIVTRDLLGWRLIGRRSRKGAAVPAAGETPPTASPADPAGDLLAIHRLTKRFGAITAVNDVSFTVQRGTIHAIVGPNGAGKTTLFNVVAGLYAADGGEILFRGRPIQQLRPPGIARAGIARTFQTVRLFGDMSVLENVLVGGHVQTRSGPLRCALRLDASEERRAIDHGMRLLATLELTAHAETPARNLSYGDQRRVEIARALASDPELVLLDEPAAGMNAVETAALASFIRRIVDELGKTVLLIEHDMALVMGLCGRVTVLDFGTVIADGPPREVQHNPAVIAAYLGVEAAATPSGTSREALSCQHGAKGE